jgi:hypothetical protein
MDVSTQKYGVEQVEVSFSSRDDREKFIKAFGVILKRNEAETVKEL